MARIIIFDTTLRDGEQSPGCTMTPDEKLRMAHQLDELGVDIIEAGFPISSLTDTTAVRRIASEVRRPVIAALARATAGDIDRAAEAVEGAERSRIHTFIATSDIHLERKLGISREQCLDRAAAAVERARRYTDDVEFSAEDATRTDAEFLAAVVEAAVQAGATTVNIPDTVGYTFPAEFQETLKELIRRVPALENDVVLSVHCHDDLGLAVANSLAGLDIGARQIECTINGIGERAGNASLEEIVMALQVRSDITDHFTRVHSTALYPSSRLLTEIIGVKPQPNKAIVGDNAFAHAAGIHQHGMLSDRETYEIMTPDTVGAPGSSLVLGKHSGRHALRHRYAQLGYELEDDELERASRYCTMLAEQKVEVTDEELLSILHHKHMDAEPTAHQIGAIEVTTKEGAALARVRISRDGAPEQEAEGTGTEPIAAVFSALGGFVQREVEVADIQVRAASPVRDPVAEVLVKCKVDGRTFSSRAAATDLMEAAARAWLNVVDKADHATLLEAAELEKEADLWAV